MVNQVSPDVAAFLMGDDSTPVQQSNAQVIDPDLGVVVAQPPAQDTPPPADTPPVVEGGQPADTSPASTFTEEEQAQFEEWKKQKAFGNDTTPQAPEKSSSFSDEAKQELDNKINELFNDVSKPAGDEEPPVEPPVETNEEPKSLDKNNENTNKELSILQENYDKLYSIAVEANEENKWYKLNQEKMEERYKEEFNKRQFLEDSLRNRTNIPDPMKDLVHYYEDYTKNPDNKLAEIKAVTVGINFIENITGVDLSPYLSSYNGNPRTNGSGSNYSSGNVSTVPHIQPRQTNEPKIQELTHDVF